MLRHVLLAASRSGAVRKLVETAPYTRSVVRRFVAGESVTSALAVTEQLVSDGLLITFDHLGEDTVEMAQAEDITAKYEETARPARRAAAPAPAPRCRSS